MEEKLKKMFEENFITEKNGKKYLNEAGSIVICFAAISILKNIFKELEIEELEEKNKSGN